MLECTQITSGRDALHWKGTYTQYTLSVALSDSRTTCHVESPLSGTGTFTKQFGST